jgi:hypothetical protein
MMRIESMLPAIAIVSNCDSQLSSHLNNWRPFKKLRAPICGDCFSRSPSFGTAVGCFVRMTLPKATAAAYLVWNYDSGSG